MADLQQRPKKSSRIIHNPARISDHHLLYKELIPYFDWFNNVNLNSYPSQLSIPQADLSLPLSSSPSHRTVFAPLELRYISPLSLSSSYSSSRQSGTYSNPQNANQASSPNHSTNGMGSAERDSLPSDALRNLYRLAERVYSHLDIGIDGKSNGRNIRTGLHGQAASDSMGDKTIENVARPAAREGSVLAPGSYSTENRHDLGVGSFVSGTLGEPSISDSVSSLYSQNTLANSTLVDTDSFYAAHDRDINSAKVAALATALEKAYAQLEHERSTKEEAENVIGALRGEVGLLTGKLERADGELEVAKEKERELVSQLQSLNASVHGLRSQVLDSEPAWAASLRAEVLASIKDLSSTTTHSFTGLTKDLKHQHHEITQLGERTSKLATSQESSMREATLGVQRHLSEKLDTLSSKMTNGHEESIGSMSWVENTIKNQIPALSSAVMEVKDVVVGMDGKLSEFQSSSTDRHSELTKALQRNAESSSVHYAQTGNLIHGLGDKLQQHIKSSAEIAYANVGAKAKTRVEEDEDITQIGQIIVALDALKALCTSSMTSIHEAIERQQTDVTTIISQISSQVERHEAATNYGDATNSHLEELNGKLSRSDATSSEILSMLEKLQDTLTGIATGGWFEQGAETTGLSKKDDLIAISNTLQHVSTQLHHLSGDGDASSLTLADLMAQLSDLSTRLASVEVEVQGAATAAVVVEEISTIKSAHSLEHQAGVTAGERMREAVLGLDEFVRGQLDLVNAALDEQQSRLVSLQTMGKQQCEDSKAISLTVEENVELLKSIESQGSNGHKTSSESINGVLGVVQEIKARVVALHDSDAARMQTLKDAPASSSDDVKELYKSMKEHQDLLRALPQRIHSEGADKHDALISKHSELIALIAGLSETLTQLSKDTHALKYAVGKVDSELTGGNAAMNERSVALENADSSIIESVDALGKEIAIIRDRLVALPTPNGTPDPTVSQQSSELLVKLEAIMNELSRARTVLGADITGSRTQSESEAKQLGISIEELKSILEKHGNTSDQEIIGLRSVIEKQSSDLVAVKEQISSTHAASSADINSQLHELMALTQNISFKEVLEHLRELGVSVVDIRGVILEEGKSITASSGILSEIQKAIETQSEQFKQTLNDQSHIGRHEAIVALLDRNHAKVSEVYEGIQTYTSETKEMGQENHAVAISILQQLLKSLESHDTLTKEQYAEILKSLKESQQYLSDKDDQQASDIHAKLSDLSQSFVELLSSHTFNSQSLREGVTHLGDSHGSLNSKVDKRFNETLDVLNRRFDSLRQEMTKEPSQVTSLMVTLQERIRSLQAENEQKHRALAESLQDDLSTLHKDLEPLHSIVVKSQENGRLIYLAEDSRNGGAHAGVEDQLQRLEQLRHSLEGIAANHHCNGCNCRGGYDSSQASPMKQRRNLSQFGSDTTGLSPLPYIEQSFDVPSPADVRKEITRNEEPAKPYSLDEAEDVVIQSPVATADSENAEHAEKRTQFSFPGPHSRTGSSSGGPGNTSGTAGGSKKEKEHHHKHQDDREISNPFELFARRPRKTSHKPSEGSEESHDAATQQRPRVKSVSTAPGRTSIGSGKSQRGSLLSSALLSAVSDNAVPTAATTRHRTVSGGLHRLSSIFGGKHHHYHEDEAHVGEASGSGSKPQVAAPTATNDGTTSHDHEHDDTTKNQEKDGKEGCA